jgi:hypothetical protein
MPSTASVGKPRNALSLNKANNIPHPIRYSMAHLAQAIIIGKVYLMRTNN